MKTDAVFSREAGSMRRFWEGRARKHPYFCVSSGKQYLREDIDFDRYFFSGEQAVLRLVLLANWHPSPDSRLLEIGCGTGRETRALATLFGSVDGIDISEAMIAKARKDLSDVENVRLRVSNGVDLAGFEACSFDYAFSHLVFRHIPYRSVIESYLTETARVLVPGGRFGYQYNGKKRLSPRRLISGPRYILRALLAAARRRVLGKPVDPGYTLSTAWRGCRVSPKDVRRICVKCGLEIDEVLGEGTDEMWIIGHKPAEAEREAA